MRYHNFDALRATAMLLGVVIHAAMPFVPIEPLIWPAADVSRGVWAPLLLVGIHAFRMQVFFVMAGFFAHMLLEKRGVGAFVKHRFTRIVIPLLLGVVLLIPVIQALFVIGMSEPGRSARFVAGRMVVDVSFYQTTLADFFASGKFVRHFQWSHLWFLFYLVMLYGLFLAALPLIRRVLAWNWPNRFFRRIARAWWKPLALAAPTILLMLPMDDWGADTPLYAWPEPRILFYYALFFGFGWVLHRHADLVETLGRFWKTHLSIAVFLALPIYLGLYSQGPIAQENLDPRFRLPALAVYGVLTWLMVLGCMGLFIRCFSKESRVMRYLSDSAYWVYLAHLPLVIVLQMAIADWPIPGILKFAGVNVVSLLLLLLSYEYAVRYTFVGAILNGRKYRKAPVNLRDARGRENRLPTPPAGYSGSSSSASGENSTPS